MLLLVVAPMSLSAYDRAQVEADAELIRLAEEEDRIFKDLQWKDESTRGQWYLFWTIHALDVYSTYRGLKYDCVKEANPLLGERPGLAQMVTHKTIFLHPFWVLQNEGVFTKQELELYNSVGSVVIYNNYRVWNKAHKVCRRL